MTATAPLHLPDDWRDWPIPAKMRLRWRLLTDWHPKRPRPNQLTPGPHALCRQSRELCEHAIAEAAKLDLDPDERLKFLAERGHIDWLIWLLLTGRGWGKTRVGAEDMAQYARSNPLSRLALVAPTFADVRDTMVEGESGLLTVLHATELFGGSIDTAWNRSIGELRLANGSWFKAFSSEKPNRLRGPQHHRAWAEELAAWENLQDTWDMLMFGLRLGEIPQVVITTTPKPKKLLIDLRSRPNVVVVRGSMYENAHNLAPAALAELKKKYEGTRMGRQELDGELIEEVEGALWTRSIIDEFRDTTAGDDRDDVLALKYVEYLHLSVVAVDPAVTATPDSDETGIIIAGKGGRTCPVCRKDEAHALVLSDRSGRLKSQAWGSRVRHAYREFMADHVTCETNNGGDLVTDNIQVTDSTIPVIGVHAKRGKKLRAQPVANLYDQGRVHHIGCFNDLEDQMCEWDPDEDDDSPDRLDALVYAITDLMIGLPTVTTSARAQSTGLRDR